MKDWLFDNRFVHELPADADRSARRRQVEHALWSAVSPTAVPAPRVLAWSSEVAMQLGLTRDDVSSEQFARVFGGNELLSGMQPFATCYGGHQFGNWAGQLGDGRAISLGELITPSGARAELQLKGAGPTPYSRTADGRAVLRSSIREFLCSEAMHHLGVPTTRALCLVATGEQVMRDMLYDGHPAYEPGAVVCRVAPSFMRFGHFELPSSRGDSALLERLIDFTIARDFAELAELPKAEQRARWFHEICVRTAVMVAHWMRIGFVHGVMNTDNMSVLGLTIDYGPYGFLDAFDPDWTPNTTDAATRRYRYGRQPQVAHWNLGCLARALAPVFSSIEPLQAGLEAYANSYERTASELTAAKLGLHELRDDDESLVEGMYECLAAAQLDMTLFFRLLSRVDLVSPTLETLHEAAYDETLWTAQRPQLEAWLQRYVTRARQDDSPPAQRAARMNAVNPRYVLRNCLAQEAIDLAEQGDASRIETLLELMRHPYDEQPEHAQFAAKAPAWAKTRVGCSKLSCSS